MLTYYVHLSISQWIADAMEELLILVSVAEQMPEGCRRLEDTIAFFAYAATTDSSLKMPC